MSDSLTAALNIQLPNVPTTTQKELHDELLSVYTALQILQVELSRIGRFIARANTTLTAGQYVAVSSVTGESKLILADATDNTKQAVGFVLISGVLNDWLVVEICGNNNLLSSLTPASQYYLSAATPGSATATKPVGVGKIVQPLGFALSATELITNISTNYTQL